MFSLTPWPHSRQNPKEFAPSGHRGQLIVCNNAQQGQDSNERQFPVRIQVSRQTAVFGGAKKISVNLLTVLWGTPNVIKSTRMGLRRGQYPKLFTWLTSNEHLLPFLTFETSPTLPPSPSHRSFNRFNQKPPSLNNPPFSDLTNIHSINQPINGNPLYRSW
jgi:hypothetical protein